MPQGRIRGRRRYGGVGPIKKLLAGCLLGLTVISYGCAATSPPEDVELVLLVRNVQPEIAESFEVGLPVTIAGTTTTLGKITDVQIQGALSAVPDADGELHAAHSPIMSDVRLTVQGEGVIDDAAGYLIDEERVYLNSSLDLRAQSILFKAEVLGLRPIGD